jgi:hypothetical protein
MQEAGNIPGNQRRKSIAINFLVDRHNLRQDHVTLLERVYAWTGSFSDKLNYMANTLANIACDNGLFSWLVLFITCFEAGVNLTSREIGLQSKSKLFNPDFPFIRCQRIISTLLLLYVAIVVQLQVGFYWHAPICEPMSTEMIDVFIDCFFIFEIILNFYTGIWYDGIYHDHVRFVAWHYITNSFPFDILTSIPVALVEFLLRQQVCSRDLMSTDARDVQGYNQMRLLRSIKPFRIFKLLRLLKAGRRKTAMCPRYLLMSHHSR